MKEAGCRKAQNGEVWPPPPVEAARTDDLPSPIWFVEQVLCFFLAFFFAVGGFPNTFLEAGIAAFNVPWFSIAAFPFAAVPVLIIAVTIFLWAKKRRTKRNAVSAILGIGAMIIVEMALWSGVFS